MDDAIFVGDSNGYSGLGSIANQNWSEWQDSNLRPPTSKEGRLTGLTIHSVCGTPRGIRTPVLTVKG
jgi:hypothetical protein